MRGLAVVAASPLLLTGAIGIGAASLSAPSAPVNGVPADIAPLIQRYGGMCPTLSPALLAAQLYVESDFNPRAASAKGAQGIAQFMPGTWSSWGRDGNGDGVRSVWDPSDAIPAAAEFDCALVNQLRNVPGPVGALMLAGYNAGPYAVLDAGGMPAFPETVRYVARVLSLVPRFGATSVGEKVVAFAFSQLGRPYEWGATGADGRFDCSGLTQAAYEAAGVSLPRTAQLQFGAMQLVPLSRLQPGDLVFFGDSATAIHHVGVYVGYGEMINAPHTGAVVRFDALDPSSVVGATRARSWS